MPEQSPALDTWAVVEVMGHKKFSGRVSEHTMGSMALIRVDVPATDQAGGRVTPEYSKLIGPGSIYCITPCTEEIARAVATELERYNEPIPASIPAQRQLPAAVGDAEILDDDFYDDDDDDDDDRGYR
jgi:hypothetical protein